MVYAPLWRNERFKHTLSCGNLYDRRGLLDAQSRFLIEALAKLLLAVEPCVIEVLSIWPKPNRSAIRFAAFRCFRKCPLAFFFTPLKFSTRAYHPLILFGESKALWGSLPGARASDWMGLFGKTLFAKVKMLEGGN
jgi:hypothetical protein